MNKYVYILQRDNVNMNYSIDLKRITELYEHEFDYLYEKFGSPLIDKKGIALFQKNVIDGSTTMLQIVKEILM